MTSKIQITDAMVQTFIRHWYVVPSNADAESFVKIRKALEAALAPEPEPTVTVEMTEAGARAISLSRTSASFLGLCDREALAANVYRAMEKARRKEAAECIAVVTPDYPYSRCHRRSTDRQGPHAISHAHRRKTDNP